MRLTGKLAVAFVVLTGPAMAHGLHDWIRQGNFRDAAGNSCCSELDCRMIPVNSGDCMVVIYGRTGNGATDNETQVHAVLTP